MRFLLPARVGTQYFGFGKEQSWQYTVTLASIHLAMIRYLLFYYVSLVNATCNFAQLRNRIGLNLKIFSYGLIAWKTISTLVSDVLDKYASHTGEIEVAARTQDA